MIEDLWASSWRTFLAASRDSVGILVVDDEPSVCKILSILLERKGYSVQTCPSAEAAWDEITSGAYQLLLVDKNLPGASGLDLITRVAEKGLQIDSIMITAYASMESIAAAFNAGASDYIEKPFTDLDRVASRVASVVQRRHLARLYEKIITDLRAVLHLEEDKLDTIGGLAARLQRFKLVLSARPDVLVVEPNGELMQRSSQALASAGLSLRSVTNADTATRMLDAIKAPVTVLLSLELPGAAALLDRVMTHDPLCRVVVSCDSPNVQAALDAVGRGATDLFVHGEESPSALVARVRRAVQESRQQRVSLNLIGIMQRAAGTEAPAETDLASALPTEHGAYLERHAQVLERVPVPELARSPHAIEAVLGRGSEERRQHSRFPSTLAVRFVPASGVGPRIEGRLENWSVAGLYARGPGLPGAATRLKVEIPLESVGEVIWVSGTIAWTDVPAGAEDGETGVGVQLDPVCHPVMFEALSATTDVFP